MSKSNQFDDRLAANEFAIRGLSLRNSWITPDPTLISARTNRDEDRTAAKNNAGLHRADNFCRMGLNYGTTEREGRSC